MKTYSLLTITLLTLAGCGGNGVNSHSDPIRDHKSLRNDVPERLRGTNEGEQGDCKFSYSVDVDGAPDSILHFTANEEKSYPIKITSTKPELFQSANSVVLITPPAGMRVVREHEKWTLRWKPIKGNFSSDNNKFRIDLIPSTVTSCVHGSNPSQEFQVSLQDFNDQPTLSILGLSSTPSSPDQPIKFQVEAFEPGLGPNDKMSQPIFKMPKSNPSGERKYVDLTSAIKCEDGVRSNKAKTFRFDCYIDHEEMLKKNPNFTGVKTAPFFASIKSIKGIESEPTTHQVSYSFAAAPVTEAKLPKAQQTPLPRPAPNKSDAATKTTAAAKPETPTPADTKVADPTKVSTPAKGKATAKTAAGPILPPPLTTTKAGAKTATGPILPPPLTKTKAAEKAVDKKSTPTSSQSQLEDKLNGSSTQKPTTKPDQKASANSGANT